MGFTGHRPGQLGGYNEHNETMTRVRKLLHNLIQRAIANGYTRFVSGMALGLDMVAANLVLQERKKNSDVKLVAAIPFKGQEKKWPIHAQKAWLAVIEQADEVYYVSDPGYAAWKMQKRNEWIVNQSNALIAVWNGRKSGTGNCVEYAKKAAHKPVIIQLTPTGSVVRIK